MDERLRLYLPSARRQRRARERRGRRGDSWRRSPNAAAGDGGETPSGTERRDAGVREEPGPGVVVVGRALEEEEPILLDRTWEEGSEVPRRREAVDPSPDRARDLRSAAEEALLWGGYPPVRSLPDDAERRPWFRDYRGTFLDRDLADLGKVADLDPLAQARAWVAAPTGRPLSYSDFARELGVAVNTAKRYLRFLEVSCQAVLLPPFLPNVERRLAKSPKVFWTDAGLARTLAERWDLGNGPLFETHVAAELLKFASFRDDAPGLHFFRTHGGLEVDLVLASAAALVGIECRASARAHASDGRALPAFLGAAADGRRRRLGIVVYRGREVAELERGVWAVPDRLLFGPTTSKG